MVRWQPLALHRWIFCCQVLPRRASTSGPTLACHLPFSILHFIYFIGNLFGILTSGIPSGERRSDMPVGIHSGILLDMLSGILSCILLLANQSGLVFLALTLTFFLAYSVIFYLTFYLTCILTFFLAFWQSIISSEISDIFSGILSDVLTLW